MNSDVHRQTDDSDKSRRLLESQLRECYGKVAYSHKSHEKCADIFVKKQKRIRISQIVLSAFTTVGFFGVIFGDTFFSALVGAFVSLVLLILNAYMKESNLGELVQRHKRAASDLWFIRESYLSLLTDLLMKERPIEMLQKSRDELLEKLHGIYASSPPTIDKGYQKAQKGNNILGSVAKTKEVCLF